MNVFLDHHDQVTATIPDLTWCDTATRYVLAALHLWWGRGWGIGWPDDGEEK